MKFLENNPTRIPILLDEKNQVGKLLGLWVHPTSYLIDSRGMLRYRVLGSADWGGIEALSTIDTLLAEK